MDHQGPGGVDDFIAVVHSNNFTTTILWVGYKRVKKLISLKATQCLGQACRAFSLKLDIKGTYCVKVSEYNDVQYLTKIMCFTYLKEFSLRNTDHASVLSYTA